MTFDDINDELSAPRGGRWVKLADKGDKVTGELLSIEMLNRTDPEGNLVLGKKSGKPRRIARVRIQTDDTSDDDGVRIFDANEAAQEALRDCIAKDGRLQPGGTITIAVTAAPRDKWSQATYGARFKPGKAKTVDLDDLIYP